MCGNKILLRHYLFYGTIQTTLETKVTVGDNTYEVLLVIHHGNTTDMILRHDVESLSHSSTDGDSDRIIDHTVLGTFHDSHLTGLVVDRHILVDNTNTTLTGNGNSHLRLRYCVHSSSNERYVQLDVTGETCFQLNHLRQYIRVCRNKEDIVKCQSVHHDFVCNK